MLKAGLFVCCGLIALPSYGASTALLEPLEYVFRAGKYVKPARLTTLAIKDLSYASKADNVVGLLELASAENRVDPIEMLQLSKTYRLTKDGDVLLLTCLRNAQCQPATFVEIAKTSRLHAEIVTRDPSLGSVQVTHAVGDVTEHLMDRYFRSSGWTRVEGQVGRAGFDGLYVKRDEGVVKDVLIAESKYNTSPLGTTNHGIQMSDDWTRRKIVELKSQFPDQPIYGDIERYIESGSYRAVLWNLKVDDDALYVKISKVKSKGGGVEIADAAGTDVETLSSPFTNNIKFNAPSNRFEERVLGWYREELNAIGPPQY
jgi:hypothetical protein